MSKRDLTAAVKAASAKRNAKPETPGAAMPTRGEEPSKNVAVRLPIALDDEIEDLVTEVNRAGRAQGTRIKKRELIEVALREIARRPADEVLGLARLHGLAK